MPAGRPLLILALVVLGADAWMACADEPLNRRIDVLVGQRLDKAKVPSSPVCDDAEFLRRAYLDLTGRIPTMAQAVAFLDSDDPDKRAKLIDELLARPEYGMYFALLWNELIVDRTDDKQLVRAFNAPSFVTWLAGELNKGAGWDKIVTAMLTADGDLQNQPAGVFLASNRVNGFPRAEDITSMTGRLFMGINLRCAQCHTHPYVDEWTQKDFWGVAAFFGQLRDHSMRFDSGDLNRNPLWSELARSDAKQEGIYIRKMRSVGQVPPQPGPNIAIPRGNDPDDIKAIVPAKLFLAESPKLPDVGPYRPTFAAWLTAKDNPYFARAAVNRLWARFFDRGLVQPVDDMGPSNAPSHPDLLDLLEREFKEARFDFKSMIRAICNSQTYQRSSRPAKGNADDRELFSHMPIRVLNPHQLLDSYSLALGRTVPINSGNRDLWTRDFMTQEPDDPAALLTHGIPQFLQMMNGSLGSGFVLPKGLGGKKKEEVITILYLSTLSRRPRQEETTRMVAHVERRLAEKAGSFDRAYLEVYWVLLNSTEFVVNR